MEKTKIFGTLKRDIAAAWDNDQKWTDLKIVSTKESLDGEKDEPVQTEFACHKFILSLKSPVFRAMILAQKDSEVLTVDIDPISLSNLLCFLYKSEIPDNKIDEKLLLSSDKFRILDLKTKCLNSMIKKITVDNAIGYFMAAKSVEAPELFSRARNFIKDNLREVMQKPDWKQSFDGQKFVNHFMGAYFSDRSDSSTQTVLVQPRERPVRIFWHHDDDWQQQLFVPGPDNVQDEDWEEVNEDELEEFEEN